MKRDVAHKALDNFLHGLNAEQREAVTSPEGPALVFAGAGSGKTRVLTGRAFYLVTEKGVHPNAIVVMTFTNKAAGELRDRLKSFLGGRTELPWAGTFHSFCARLLRTHGEDIGLSRDFTIYDTEDSEQLLAQILAARHISRDELSPVLLRGWISLLKNGGRLSKRHPMHRHVSDLLAEYNDRLHAAQSLDFDDLLHRPLELFASRPTILDRLQHRYDHILIDEFQDTNAVQYELARQLAAPQNNLFVVGDDDQSIYSWRGADYRNIIEFKKHFAETRVFRLEQNYRSTAAILAVANDVICLNRQRAEKRLWTDRKGGERAVLRQAARPIDEAHEVVGEIHHLLRTKGYSARDVAILYRTNALSREFEDVLISEAIPYTIVGGTRFYERKEVKDLIAHLRLMVNLSDEQAWRRVLRVPPKGIGDVTLGQLEDEARRRRCGIGDVLVHLDDSELPRLGRSKLKPVVDQILALRRQLSDLDLVKKVEEVLASSGLVDYYAQDRDERAEERIENLRQLPAAAADRQAEHPEYELAEFLAEIALIADVDDYDDKAERVTLMTMHAAKGLEFPVVFAVGLEENLVPHIRSTGSPAELEEERRLFYVACTRAGDRLYLTYAQERYVQGMLRLQEPSRFLYDIAPQHLRGWSLPGRSSVSDPEEDFEQDERPVTPRSKKEGADVRVNVSGVLVPYKIGDVVEHPDFGVGVVIAKSGDAENLKVRIAFEGMGSKLLAVKYAPLKRISDGYGRS